MALPADARRLLDAIESRFDQPDWPAVKEWLESESARERALSRPTVPATLDDLGAPATPLSPGDLVAGPLLLRGASETLPAGSRFDASVYALGDLVVEEGVTLAGDLIVDSLLHWRGGAGSRARSVSAAALRLGAPGTFDGGILCERLEGAIPPGTVVRGVVVVGEASEEPVTVGEGARLGALYTPGDVRVGEGAQIGQIRAGGEVILGEGVRVGSVQGAAIRVGPRARVARAESEGALHIEAEALVDSAEAGGDIHLGRGVRLTGHTLQSARGQLYAEDDARWHGQPDHWFYLLPDGALHPYVQGRRPEGAAVVALRTHTHELWQQTARLSGRDVP